MNYRLAGLVLLLSISDIFAADVPSAGSQIQQIPAAPASGRPAPQLPSAPGAAPVEAPGGEARLVVKSLHLSNVRHFTETELLASTGFTPGSELTLAALRGYAATITNYYRSRGYFLARATLPAQDVIDGAVTITVIEGEYGKVVLRNESRLSDGVALTLLDGLETGDPVRIAPLETRLLLLSDLPGVIVKSTLVPGASVGASDLIVDVTPGALFTGSVDADNSGSRYTGEFRSGATVNLNNAFGRGDVATLRAFTSWDGLNYGRAAYQQQFGRADAGLAYTALDYELGREFETLRAHGKAQIASLYGRYPLRRSRSTTVYAQVNVDAKKFRDTLDVTAVPTITDKKAEVAMLSVVGDHRDRLAGGGLSRFSFTWTSGNLDLEGTQARNADSATVRTGGHYDKFAITALRLQNLTSSLSLYAAAQGQLSSQNLDASEKMPLGGLSGVRAYAEGDIYVDEGYTATLELRLSLLRVVAALPGQLQLTGFVDQAGGNVSRNVWSAGSNSRSLTGGGVGLNWFDSGNFVLKLQYAHALGGAEPALVSSSDGRISINGVKYF